jgi:hypothetical protein
VCGAGMCGWWWCVCVCVGGGLCFHTYTRTRAYIKIHVHTHTIVNKHVYTHPTTHIKVDECRILVSVLRERFYT